VPSIEYARAYLEAARAAKPDIDDGDGDGGGDGAGNGVEGTVESGPTPRMIMLTTPHNPTGTVMSNETLQKWYDLAREYEIALVLDETYRDFVVDHEPGDADEVRRVEPHKLFDLPDWRGTLVSLGSFSSTSFHPW
jgi:aspartate/methionine/tyrosine aminotransferase